MKPGKLEHGFWRINAEIPIILYLKGMRILMFQLSGFYCRLLGFRAWGLRGFLVVISKF